MQLFRTVSVFLIATYFVAVSRAAEQEEVIQRPFPQAGVQEEGDLRDGVIKPATLSQAEMNAAVLRYYEFWKAKYLKPSRRVPSDYKIAFERSGTTVSEAMGYGMLITVMMAGADSHARAAFDGLDRFRKRYPSNINPVFMCWRIPASEKVVSDDSATDGDMDMALALLMAHRQWGDEAYLDEAKPLIQALGTALVRPDCSLRLGDWDTNSSGTVLTRTSDFMPTHFRAFRKVSGEEIWDQVENRCDTILLNLQNKYAPRTGLIPDFAEAKAGSWKPARPKALEGPQDGEYSYNACRVPWRYGWEAVACDDARARKILKRLMSWATSQVDVADDFKAGYSLGGKCLRGADFDSACFITPTGVAAMCTGDQAWCDQAFAYGENAKEGYYPDTVNLLCLLVLSGNAWLP